MSSNPSLPVQISASIQIKNYLMHLVRKYRDDKSLFEVLCLETNQSTAFYMATHKNLNAFKSIPFLPTWEISIIVWN